MFFAVRILTREIHFQVKYKEMVQELEHPTAGRIRVPGYHANCSRDSSHSLQLVVRSNNSCEGDH